MGQKIGLHLPTEVSPTTRGTSSSSVADSSSAGSHASPEEATALMKPRMESLGPRDETSKNWNYWSDLFALKYTAWKFGSGNSTIYKVIYALERKKSNDAADFQKWPFSGTLLNSLYLSA